jgi:hypothetical protein
MAIKNDRPVTIAEVNVLKDILRRVWLHSHEESFIAVLDEDTLDIMKTIIKKS